MIAAKRVLFTTLGFLLLITAACWGYWSYRQFRSFQTTIPRETTSLVRVHVDGIVRDVTWNMLWNRAHAPEGEQSIRFDTWKPMGIRIPANLFLYQVDHPLSDKFPDAYFGSVAVDNPTALIEWLRNRPGMEIGNSEYGTMASSERVLVVIQSQRALFALLPTKPKAGISLLADVLVNILQHYGGSVAVGKSDLRAIMHDNGQVCSRGSYLFSINFKSGMITFNSLYNMGYTPDGLASTPHFDDSNAASLWIQGSPASLLQGRQFDIGGHTLHGDSLLMHYNGHLTLEWKGIVNQSDTIVNYDYNDDFELIEVEEIIDKQVPEIYCSISADTALIDYLHGRGILQQPNNIVATNVFPLFQINVHPLPSGYVQLHTADRMHALPERSSLRRDDILYLRADFNKLPIPDQSTIFTHCIQAVDLLELSGQPATGNCMVIQGTLHMKNPKLHSITQLMGLH